MGGGQEGIMNALTVKELYTLEETIAKDIFEGVTYPWEVLPKISGFILELGASLSEEEYEKRGENIWVAKSAKVAPTAISTILQSSGRMQRSDTVHLSVEMQLLEKVLL